MKFSEYLKGIGTCKQGMDWCGEKSLSESWATCERGDWMLWLMENAGMCCVEMLALAKAKCAELTRPLMKDKESIDTLQAAFDFANGIINEAESNIIASLIYSRYESAIDAINDAISLELICARETDELWELRQKAAAMSASAAAYTAALSNSNSLEVGSWVREALNFGRLHIKPLKMCADICREVLPVPYIKGVN